MVGRRGARPWLIGKLEESAFRGMARHSGRPIDEVRAEARAAATAWDALALGRLDDAADGAQAILRRPDGEARLAGRADEHDAHLITGHVHLRRGDVEAAERELYEAATVADVSPALSSFGPNMSLADALLRQGRTDAAMRYLDLCGAMWKGPGSARQLAGWRADIAADRVPDFGGNLVYGTGALGYRPGPGDG